jgi:hypothetical protein
VTLLSYKSWINEKFSDNTDPVADMGIGGVLLNTVFNKRRKKVEKDIEKLRIKADEDWKLYLRDILVNKTITAEMMKLATYDKDTMDMKSNAERGKFTVKVVDIVVETLEKDWNDYVMIASDNHEVFRLSFNKKIYILDK